MFPTLARAILHHFVRMEIHGNESGFHSALWKLARTRLFFVVPTPLRAKSQQAKSFYRCSSVLAFANARSDTETVIFVEAAEQ